MFGSGTRYVQLTAFGLPLYEREENEIATLSAGLADRDRSPSMKKLPEITMQDWLEAEETVKRSRIMAKPAGFTANEYAKARGCTIPTARRYLLDMFHTGLADRIKWHNGNQGGVFVYQLKK